MSLAAACGWTLLRSLTIALVALPLCGLLARLMAGSPGGRLASRPQWLVWAVLLVPFFTPELLTGYGYGRFALALVHYPAWNEVLYAVLAGMKVVPVGTAALLFAPPSPLSPEALHCRRLALRPSDGRARRLWIVAGDWTRGPLRRGLPAWLLMFLLAFQEFETASLMGATSWTVWLFDAQAGGLALSVSLRHALLPLACQVVVLAPVLLVLFRDRSLPAAPHAPRRPPGRWGRLLAWCYLVVAAAAVCGIPMRMTGDGLPGGLAALGRSTEQAAGLAREIGRGGLLALVSGLLAYALGAWLLSPPGVRRRLRGAGDSDGLEIRPAPPLPHSKGVLGLVLSVWGLFGTLIVSLIVLALFQQPVLNAVYGTMLPPVFALVLFLLPRVLVLQVLLHALRPSEALYLATALARSGGALQRGQGRELLWRLEWQRHFWLAALACWWAYLDLTAAALLTPPGMMTAPVRLYNLMHYGHSEVLSALTFVTVAVPVCVIVLVVVSRRLVLRWLV